MSFRVLKKWSPLIVVVGATILSGCDLAATSPTPTGTTSPSTTSSPSVPSGWTQYSSTSQHLSFYHPTSWGVVCDAAGSNWLLIDTNNLYTSTSCPQGDGQLGIFVASVTGTGQPTGLGTISANSSLYSNVQRTGPTVAGVTCSRLTGDQSAGQGSGTAQVEYDCQYNGRTYYVLAILGTALTASQVDQLVQTISFSS